jgi:hypothetical protein
VYLGTLCHSCISYCTERKSLNIVNKHVFICSNPYIYTIAVQEVYNQDRSPEDDDVEGLAAAATKHLELLKQKDKAEGSFLIVLVYTS